LVDEDLGARLEGEQLLEVELAFDEITPEKIASRTITQVLRIQTTQDPAQVTLNGEVAAWVATQRAGNTVRTVTDRMSHGKVEEAGSLLDEAVAQLRAYSGDDQKITDALKSLQELKAQWVHGMTSRSLKEAHFTGSRLHRMSSREYWEKMQQAPSFYKPPPPPPPTDSP